MKNYPNLKKLSYLLLLVLVGTACAEDESKPKQEKQEIVEPEPPPVVEYGYVLDDYVVERDTVRSGDSFGQILFENGIDYGRIQNITDSVKDVFDTRLIKVGKSYTLLKSKDSLERASVFIYEQNNIDYVVVDFEKDSISAAAEKKPVTIVEKTAIGTIDSNLSTTFEDLGVNILVAYNMADIYAWTIDFFRLQPGDKFKVVYTEKYVNDTIFGGFGEIKASWFEHRGEPIYAFKYENDSIPGKRDYFDEEANNLRRAFLKGPLKFSRVSSRYNLKRRIAYYGNRIRPHRGTDFAGAVGTPIMATADGTVTKSEYRGGNGNYVKIRHNNTYETQYLHMSKRAVKVGEYVRQGEVIGYIGMTGNTSGPHVCYRFWKHGRQVDPFKEKLPEAEPLSDAFKPDFYEKTAPLKEQLDNLKFENIL